MADDHGCLDTRPGEKFQREVRDSAGQIIGIIREDEPMSPSASMSRAFYPRAKQPERSPDMRSQAEIEAAWRALWEFLRTHDEPGEELDEISEDAAERMRAAMGLALDAADKAAWRPIEEAPKGGGADRITDPAWVKPPRILLRFGDEAVSVAYWDWYYAAGGNGFAWIEPCSGELLNLHYSSPPTHWRPITSLPSEPA